MTTTHYHVHFKARSHTPMFSPSGPWAIQKVSLFGPTYGTNK